MKEVASVTFHGLDALRLQAPDGASAIVTCHGAHVVSWIPAGGEERLYLSDLSAFDGKAPIRGGVPVVFPQFATYGPLPHHGLLRTRAWQITAGRETNGGRVRATLRVHDCPDTRKFWPHAFTAELSVEVGGDRLDLELEISNTEETPVQFSAALHTYLRVADVRTAGLEGLHGVRYLDRTREDRPGTQSAEVLTVSGEVDRIYLDVPNTLRLREPHRPLDIQAEGFPDVVVWNPWKDKSGRLPDMPDNDFRRMLCVEAAVVAKPIALRGGDHWVGRQTLIASTWR
jgi:glucose-6-phosphate 1-epimerase